MIDLEAAKALLAAGGAIFDQYRGYLMAHVGDPSADDTEKAAPNAAFIATIPVLVGELIAEVERLQEALLDAEMDEDGLRITLAKNIALERERDALRTALKVLCHEIDEEANKGFKPGFGPRLARMVSTASDVLLAASDPGTEWPSVSAPPAEKNPT